MKTEELVTKALNRLFYFAATKGIRFRQYFYPNLPKAYEVNPKIRATIRKELQHGKTPKEIADKIFKDHG